MELVNGSYYRSEKYKNDILERIGLNDLAVEMNARFALDFYRECEKEYLRTKNLKAFSLLDDLPNILFGMIQKSFSRYHAMKMGRESEVRSCLEVTQGREKSI